MKNTLNTSKTGKSFATRLYD